MSKRSARRARRARLFEEQHGDCWYCTGAMRLMTDDVARQPPDMMTLEHVIQKAEGGTYDLDNCKGACVACNVSRPHKLESDAYLKLRRDLLVIWPPCTYPDKAVRRRLQRASPQSLYTLILERTETHGA